MARRSIQDAAAPGWARERRVRFGKMGVKRAVRRVGRSASSSSQESAMLVFSGLSREPATSDRPAMGKPAWSTPSRFALKIPEARCL